MKSEFDPITQYLLGEDEEFEESDFNMFLNSNYNRKLKKRKRD